MKQYAGMFVVVDGMDGSGKSTVVEMLRQELEHQLVDVLKTREIGGTPIAEELRKLCFQTRPEEPLGSAAQTLMSFAARLQHTEQVIRPALQRGQFVVCDRYSSSTRVYQGILRQEKAMVETLEREFVTTGQVLNPDLYVFLNVDPIKAYQRGAARTGLDNDAFKKGEQQARVIHSAYEVVFDKIRREHKSPVLEINTARPMEEVAAIVKDLAKAIISLSTIKDQHQLIQRHMDLNRTKL
mgnify:CR=1 FL=1